MAKAAATSSGECVNCHHPVSEGARYQLTSVVIHTKCAKALIEITRNQNRAWFQGSYALEAGLLRVSAEYLRPSRPGRFN